MKKWFDKEAKLVGHILMAMVLFAVVGLAAAGLGMFVHWLEVLGVAHKVIVILDAVEYLLFLADVVVFMAWVIKSLKDFFGGKDE